VVGECGAGWCNSVIKSICLSRVNETCFCGYLLTETLLWNTSKCQLRLVVIVGNVVDS